MSTTAGLQKYAQALRRTVEDYYDQRLSFADYRAERNGILDSIEGDLLRKGDDAQRQDARPIGTQHSA